MSKVKIIAAEDGTVVRATSNPDYGYVLVASEVQEFKGGWMRTSKRTAIISGEMVALKNAGFYAGQELEGKIQVTEQTEPFEGDPNPERSMKIAGDTGIPCKLDGKPIYRKSEFTSDLGAQDKFIEHNNGEEISAAYAQSEASQPANNGNAEL